jgi:hypothetical protein
MKKTLSVVSNDAATPVITKEQFIIVEFQDGKVKGHADIKGYSINGPYFVVQQTDDTQYIYPMANVQFIKISVNTIAEE